MSQPLTAGPSLPLDPDTDRSGNALLLDHLRGVRHAVAGLDEHVPRLERWGRVLARVLGGGGRLLVAGNGGSAAQAQHLSSELSGRFREERRPLAAIALHTDGSALTAIGNDYGFKHVFARQVRALGRTGDVLLCLSTSGRSPNLLAAATTARDGGLTCWALTGPEPNPLHLIVDDGVSIASRDTAVVQDCHQVLVHLIAWAVEHHVIQGTDQAETGTDRP
jgi:D-sedoheptulose 7-phosphate isomerase